MLMLPEKKQLTTVAVVCFACCAWVVVTWLGCGQNRNITPANVILSGKVTLSWNDVPGAASYNVYLSRSPGVTRLSGYKIRNATNPITIIDLQPGITYYFVVTVVTESGESDQSEELSHAVTDKPGFIDFKDLISQPPPNQPATQSDANESEKISSSQSSEANANRISSGNRTRREDQSLEATDKEAGRAAARSKRMDGQVVLAWDNVSDAASYNIYWSDSPGVTKHDGNKIPNVNNPHTMKGLERGVTYYFVVTAVNEFGESKESKEISFTVK